MASSARRTSARVSKPVVREDQVDEDDQGHGYLDDSDKDPVQLPCPRMRKKRNALNRFQTTPGE